MIKSFALFVALWLTFSANLVLASSELYLVHTYGKNILEPILSGFTRETGIRLHSEFRNQGDLKSGMVQMMELNAVPDAIIMPADHAGMYRLLKYSALDPHLFTANIPERIWMSGMSDGTIYGAPIIQGNHLVLFYNKSLVKQPARTWDELFLQKQELEARGLATIAWSYDEPYWFLPFLGAYGGWPINNGKLELNSPAMASALTFYKSLRERKLPYPNCSYDQSVDLFKTEKVAYTINGEWVSKSFAEALGDKLGVSALPKAEGKKLLPTFSTYIIALPNDGLHSAKRAELIKFINYMQSPKVQRQLWDQVYVIPVESSAFSYAQQNAQGYMKQILELMKDTRPLASDEAVSYIWDAIGKGFVRYREGAMSAQDSAKFMQQLVERHLRNAQLQSAPVKTTP